MNVVAQHRAEHGLGSGVLHAESGSDAESVLSEVSEEDRDYGGASDDDGAELANSHVEADDLASEGRERCASQDMQPVALGPHQAVLKHLNKWDTSFVYPPLRMAG